MRISIQILIFLLSISLFISCSNKTELERHKSPDGKSEAILFRSESGRLRDKFGIVWKDIYLTTIVNGKEIKTKNPIWAERPDGEIATDFEKAFQIRKWNDNQIFFIGYDENQIKSDLKVSVKNNSTKTINQAVIRGDGIFIINIIQPNETVDIPIILMDENPQRKCRILLDIDFSDGTGIPLDYSAFRLVSSKEGSSKCVNSELVVFDDRVDLKLLQ